MCNDWKRIVALRHFRDGNQVAQPRVCYEPVWNTDCSTTVQEVTTIMRKLLIVATAIAVVLCGSLPAFASYHGSANQCRVVCRPTINGNVICEVQC